MASDANGSFKLEFIPQKRMEYLLRISYIGMSTIFRKLDPHMMDIDCGHILMESGIKLARSAGDCSRQRDRYGRGYDRN